MRLKDLNIGDTGIVQQIDLPFEMERRLQALGMTAQTPVTVLNKKGQGIMVIKLRGSRFALGVDITKNITVEEKKAP